MTNPPEKIRPMRVKANALTAEASPGSTATGALPRASSIADFEKAQSDIMDAIARIKERAKTSAQSKVGHRGPVPASKGLVVPGRETKQKTRKKKKKSNGILRNKIPYRTCFVDLRPRAGYLYDGIDSMPRQSGEAVRDRIGELSENGQINISAFDDRLREAFDAATEIAKREILCPETLIERLIQEVPWLEGLDTVTVGHCLDYFDRARGAYMEKYPPNSYRPGGHSDPGSAQALDRFSLATTAWTLVSGVNGLVDLPVCPFELEEGQALKDEWVDETERSGSDDDIIRIIGLQKQRLRARKIAGRSGQQGGQMELDHSVTQPHASVKTSGSAHGVSVRTEHLADTQGSGNEL